MYTPPVSRLLTFGPSFLRSQGWYDYIGLGLGPENIADLIQMATSIDLHNGPAPEAYAPIHAWRALAQLHAVEAIEPLISLFHMLSDNDYVSDDLPRALAKIGPSTLPALARYMNRSDREMYPRVCAVDAVAHTGVLEPQCRTECIAILSEQLSHFAIQDRVFNAFIVNGLLKLKAIEAMPSIEHAYAADQVDFSICGDLEDVQVELGILPRRQTPRPRYHDPLMDNFIDNFYALKPGTPSAQRQAKDAAKQKAKRKVSQASRRQNRRR